jgi:Cys-tRNA(Pro)/Cys-tRNA(Cys) deacylase
MRAATPAIAVLVKAGVRHRTHRYDHDPARASYGQEAGEAMGVEPERMFKTLVAAVDDRLVVAVVPVAATLDLKALAAALGAKRAEMADPGDAERSSGYVLGAISPLGQKRRLTTVIDESVQQWDTMFCSGGHRGLEIELAPADLVRLTGARVAPVARRDRP